MSQQVPQVRHPLLTQISPGVARVITHHMVSNKACHGTTCTPLVTLNALNMIRGCRLLFTEDMFPEKHFSAFRSDLILKKEVMTWLTFFKAFRGQSACMICSGTRQRIDLNMFANLQPLLLEQLYFLSLLMIVKICSAWGALQQEPRRGSQTHSDPCARRCVLSLCKTSVVCPFLCKWLGSWGQ